MGTFYLVATPIGNLEEITKRALNVLNNVEFILAEDTRNFAVLARHYDIKTRVVSCHEHNQNGRIEEIIKTLKSADVALVSDAGMPLISDPGYPLVQEVIAHGFKVSAVSGPSALINALVSSGFNTNHFYFHGFLNRDNVKNELEDLKDYSSTMIFYESKHRIIETLKIMMEVFDNREIAVARELTKMYEEIIRGPISEIIEKINPLGEFVIIVTGITRKSEEKEDLPEEIKNLIKKLKEQGISRKDCLDIVAETLSIDRQKISKYYLSLN